MKRIHTVAAVAAAAAVCLIAAPVTAVAQTPQAARADVGVLWLDGTTLEDWSEPGLPTFRAFLSRAAIGLVVGPPGTDRRLAARTIADGDAVPLRPNADACTGNTAFTRALAARGLRSTVIGSATGTDRRDRTVACMFDTSFGRGDRPRETLAATARLDSNFPTGARASVPVIARLIRTAAATTEVLVVDPGDTARVERALGDDARGRAPWVAESMRTADGILAAMHDALGADATIVVVSASTSRAAEARGLRLGAFAMAGPAIARGLATSATTDVRGVIDVADIGPTILRLAGARPPDGSSATPVGVARANHPDGRALALHGALARAAAAHDAVALTAILLALCAIWGAAALVVTGRGAPPPRSRIPTTARDATATFAIAAIAYAVTATLLPARAPAPTLAGAIGVSLVWAIGARAALGRWRALIATLAVCAVSVTLDALLGGPLATRGALAEPVASGLRGGASGEAGAAIAGVATALLAALLLDRARERPRVTIVAAAGCAAAAMAVSLPWFGGVAFGGSFVVVAVGIPLLRAIGAPIRTSALVVTAAAVGVAGFAAVAASSPDALGARWSLGDVRRALEADARSFAALVLLVMPPVLLAVRRPQLVGRALWGRPHARAAFGSIAVAGVAGIALIVGGAATAAIAASIGGATWAVLFAAPAD